MKEYFVMSLALVAFYLVATAEPKMNRSVAQGTCQMNGEGCPFFIIGHRGAPYISAENTVQSFKDAIDRGANSIEIDLVFTKDAVPVVYHDRTPGEFISLIRQAGLEGLPYIPYNPNIGDNLRRPVDDLTFKQLRENYGYAPSEGFFKDLFTSGKLDPSAVIPSYEEFVNWAKTESRLQSVIIDLKLDSEDPERVFDCFNQVTALSKGSQFKVYLSAPKEDLFRLLKSWERFNLNREENPHIGHILFDLEKDGALKATQSYPLYGLMTGKTVLRRWESFWKDLDKVIRYRENNPERELYPLITWTIDDQHDLYKMLQKGVDGVITNRPRDLARLVERHFKDHSNLSQHLAMCWQSFKGERSWHFCSSGKELDPFLPIGKRELKAWTCKKSRSREEKRLLGCGTTSGKRLKFSNEMDNSGNVNIWYNPQHGGKVHVARTMESFDRDKVPFILRFDQTRCRDGFFNYDCEYKIHVEYLDSERNRFIPLRNAYHNYDSSFTFISNAPKGTEVLKVTIYETDDGRVAGRRSMASGFLYFDDGHRRKLKAYDDTFRGNVLVRTFDYGELHEEHQEWKAISARYTQQKCYDGVFNYDCEYKTKLEYSVDGFQYYILGPHLINTESSFSLYARIPKETNFLRITIFETDDGKIKKDGKAQSTIVVPYEHGHTSRIRSYDNTFRGTLVIRTQDYDPHLFDSEGRYVIPYQLGRNGGY